MSMSLNNFFHHYLVTDGVSTIMVFQAVLYSSHLAESHIIIKKQSKSTGDIHFKDIVVVVSQQNNCSFSLSLQLTACGCLSVQASSTLTYVSSHLDPCSLPSYVSLKKNMGVYPKH